MTYINRLNAFFYLSKTETINNLDKDLTTSIEIIKPSGWIVKHSISVQSYPLSKLVPCNAREKKRKHQLKTQLRPVTDYNQTFNKGISSAITEFISVDFPKNPNQFDLVITDMTMPTMTGAELAQRIIAFSPQTPVILCTGQSGTDQKRKSHLLGNSRLLE